MLATGGFRFWQYRQAQAAQAAGGAFQAALRLDAEGKPDEARAALDKLQASAPQGYAHLGRFVDAALKLKKDPKAGIAAYDALAADSALDPLLRDTAKLRAALARLDAGETDAAEAALEPLAASSPYRETARLTLASIAIAAKDYPAAGEMARPGDRRRRKRRRPTAAPRETLLGLVASQAPSARKSS